VSLALEPWSHARGATPRPPTPRARGSRATRETHREPPQAPSEVKCFDAGPAFEDFGKGLMMPVTALGKGPIMSL